MISSLLLRLRAPEQDKEIDWSALSWPQQPAAQAPEAYTAPAAGAVPAPYTVGPLPSGYTACDWFDPVSATGSLYQLARKHGGTHEDLWAAYDLIEAGQYELAIEAYTRSLELEPE